MGEYIEREAVINRLLKVSMTDDVYGMGIQRGVDHAVDVINEAPAADVEPVKRGEWLARARKNGVGKCCSACMAACTFAPMPYCPNCGAKMKG